MIRAIDRDGKIEPLDPRPAHWGEGRELQIIEAEPSDDPEEIEKWWNELRNGPDDPEDWQRFEAALAEADRVAKDQVRKEMGLD